MLGLMKGFDRKLFLGIFLILMLFVPFVAGSVLSIRKIVSAQNELVSTYAEELLLARDLRRYLTEQTAAIPVFVLTGDPRQVEIFEEASRNFTATVIRLEKLDDDKNNDALLEDIRRHQEQLHDLAQPGIRLKLSGASIERVNEHFRNTGGPSAENLGRKLDQFVQYTANAYEAEKNGNLQMSHQILKTLAVASALSLIFLLAVCGLLVKLVRDRRAYEETNRMLIRREQELSSARKEAVEVVAHDLKNPLASIIMNSQLALRREKTANESRRTFEMTLKSARSMKSLIDNLLDHTKIEAGKLELKREECQLGQVVLAVCERMEAIAQAQRKNLRLSIEEGLPSLSLDAARMEQVISNILGNAVKFSPEGGEIHLQLRSHLNALELSVTDSGLGMSQEEKDHVFERYWQGREGAHKGTGLGLAISNAIVKAHGGMIRVESERGRGSCFTVILPLTAAAESGHEKRGAHSLHAPQADRLDS